MKTTIKKTIVILISILSFATYAQKKVRSFTVKRIIPSDVESVWKVVGDDFGAIANSHPKIMSSNYNQGSITYGGEGAVRVCNLNEKGTKYIKEKQLNFDPENHSFTVQILHTEGIPLDPEYTKATYTVHSINDTTSEIEFKMDYRTNPGFLGGIAKGKFKKGIDDYLIAVEHYTTTGEKVNKDNFKKIKSQYK